MQEILARGSNVGQIPMIQTAGSHDYVTLVRLKTPFELTQDGSHPIYNDIESRNFGFKFDFEVPEVVAKWATPKAIQIDLSPPIQVFPPIKHFPNWIDAYGKYTAVVGRWDKEEKDKPKYPNYILLGVEDCKKQIAAWGLSGSKIDWFLRD
jgi:hypothetical protein